MDRMYHVTSMKVMNLRSQETMSGRKEFIVVGATAICGEDVYSKGRVSLIQFPGFIPGSSIPGLILVPVTLFTVVYQIMIFDVIEVIPEPGKPLTKHKMKVSAELHPLPL